MLVYKWPGISTIPSVIIHKNKPWSGNEGKMESDKRLVSSSQMYGAEGTCDQTLRPKTHISHLETGLQVNLRVAVIKGRKIDHKRQLVAVDRWKCDKDERISQKGNRQPRRNDGRLCTGAALF